MRAVCAWMLVAGVCAALLAGCDKPKQEPVVTAPPQETPPPFPESQVPMAEHPAPVAAAPERPTVPEPVDESVAPQPRRDKAAAKPAPKESYSRAPKKASQTYVVKKGDTLQKISQKYYGTTKNWRKIFEANRKEIKDPDKLAEGTRLRIP